MTFQRQGKDPSKEQGGYETHWGTPFKMVGGYIHQQVDSMRRWSLPEVGVLDHPYFHSAHTNELERPPGVHPVWK